MSRRCVIWRVSKPQGIERTDVLSLWKEGKVSGMFNLRTRQQFDACEDFCIEEESGSRQEAVSIDKADGETREALSIAHEKILLLELSKEESDKREQRLRAENGKLAKRISELENEMKEKQGERRQREERISELEEELDDMKSKLKEERKSLKETTLENMKLRKKVMKMEQAEKERKVEAERFGIRFSEQREEETEHEEKETDEDEKQRARQEINERLLRSLLEFTPSDVSKL